ncbi:MAG: type I DNA topoisomerase [Crocinitomicaceae bacterium]|nr:type I DNA topoisomerase [Crocinitomicaceae bacterium]MCF8409836.1 type I DNA topoisomerase [Crocinitomicaceae bacterium]MCF8444353.1 type I DNA topoisomerase [Crocinitomicaceae bacterium]
MAKNLVIVESPAKAKTIEGYLGKDYVVKSSFGHVRDLPKKGLSIDLENNFHPNYEVSTDKKQLVSELKKLAAAADTVWLATDEDREGEAISWHLFEALNLEKKDTKRITFNEITKAAILKAIENPRKINKELVDAQQARRVLDRIVGFELSPVLWKKVRPSLSAGRVQSVAVRLIVEREKEIDQHNSKNFFKVIGNFRSENGLIKAELDEQLKAQTEAQTLLENLRTASFSISDIQQKPATKSPSAPFTTSTLQQEASLKLGFSVSRTMSVAQRLYESGKITYMRTDSVNLSDTAVEGAKNAILSMFGENYSKPTKYKNKNANAQEAHEAIRPTDFTVSTIEAEREEQKLYELIWKRSISSQMALAQLERTTMKIGNSNTKDSFTARGEVIRFDGFLKVYMESSMDDDDDDQNTEGILPAVKVGEKVDRNEIIATERFSRPPARYMEASLVKKLEELGIGRPSTYAPTISTIQKRGYVEKLEREGVERKFAVITLSNNEIETITKSEITGKDRNKLTPTDIGVVVTDFLCDHFSRIMDYQFTAKVEEEFDHIAQGLESWTDMIRSFYDPFHQNVTHTLETSERVTGERELGTDPKTGKRVSARIGRFGPMIMLGGEEKEEDGGEKPTYASLKKEQSIQTITLEEALELFKLPRTVGEHEGEVVKANSGRFGPYVQIGKVFVSIPKEEDPMTITLERAVELMENKKLADASKLLKSFPEREDVQILDGRWGAYLKIGKNNYKLPKGTEIENLELEKCLEMAVEQDKAPKKKPFRKK